MTRSRDELERAYDAEFYREAYPDLASLAAGELREHWIGSGASEGRWASFTDLVAAHPEVDVSGFDPQEFLLANPDLPPMPGAAAAIYWVLYGWREGREMRLPALPPVVLRRLAAAVLADASLREEASDPRALLVALRSAPHEGLAAGLLGPAVGTTEREYAISLFERIHDRVPSPREVTLALGALSRGGARSLVEAVVRGAFRDPETLRILSGADEPADGDGPLPRAFTPLGSDRPVTFDEWEARREAASRTRGGAQASGAEVVPARVTETAPARASELAPVRVTGPSPAPGAGSSRVPQAAAPVVSILCSLYRGGRHIEAYLSNLTGQEGFRSHELIVVDACSPEGEGSVVKEYARSFPGIVYLRERTRIGIYEAWNVALRLARGRYATNANLDDSRHPDSLAAMAAALDALPGVDVVYSDVFYTLVPHLPWETVERIGVRTDLPPLTTWNLLEFNSPHCAPMWRRSLHDRLGEFDVSFTSAGDWEFWLRCAARGVLFHRLPEPLIAYTFNPEGISTRRGTAGIREQWPIRVRYRELLAQPERGLDPLRPLAEERAAGVPLRKRAT